MLIQNPIIKPKEFRVHVDFPYAKDQFTKEFYNIFSKTFKPSPVIVLCIGTDRSTGDSLGPLVGEKLKKLCKHAEILGSLEKPVHAVNLEKVLNNISSTYNNPFIIAIDASLGRIENVGTIKLGHGALKPGAAVNKDLPAVGDFHITGVVNVGGFMEYMVLQNTRLFTVMKMVDIISYGVASGLKKYFE